MKNTCIFCAGMNVTRLAADVASTADADDACCGCGDVPPTCDCGGGTNGSSPALPFSSTMPSIAPPHLSNCSSSMVSSGNL